MKTSLADVSNQIQKFWSPLFVKELREKLLLASLVNKDYQGEIRQKGDTVKVSQVIAPTGELRTVGVDADVFESQKIQTQQVDIKADKRAVAAYEVEDLVDLQSQIDKDDSEVRQSLLYAVEKQINDYLYSLVAPSASAPDHTLVKTDFNAGVLTELRMLASQAKWMKNKPWYILADPSYTKDMLDSQVLTSADFVSDQPVVGGQISQKRYGWNILEDDSRPTDYAIAFHPDFLHLVTQTEAQFKLSDLHSQKKFGYLLSVDIIFGAKLGIAGNVKHILITGS